MDIKELMQDIDGMREHQMVMVNELCIRANVAPKTYKNWVSGKTIPSLAALNAVLEALHIELIPLFQEKE